MTSLRDHLLARWLARPEEIRYAPAAEVALDAFEHTYRPMPPAYRWFLSACGGGVVGSEWIDGIEQLPSTHAKFEGERGEDGWTLVHVFIIGWSGAGNPIVIDEKTGAVLTEDHNFGGIQQLAPSFMKYLSSGLLHGDA